jgi:hypothetical protein
MSSNCLVQLFITFCFSEISQNLKELVMPQSIGLLSDNVNMDEGSVEDLIAKGKSAASFFDINMAHVLVNP